MMQYLLIQLVGALTQPFFNDTFGRKVTILYASLVFVVGVIMQAAATNLALLFVGRAVGGYALATIAIAVQMYNAEVSPKEIRGKVVGIQQVMAAFGIAVAYWTNYGIKLSFTNGGSVQGEATFRLPFALQAVPTVLLAIGIIFVPHSPRWLGMKNRWEEAAQSLSKLRGVPVDDESVQKELGDIRLAIEEQARKGTWAEVFSSRNVPRLLVGVPVCICIYVWGVNRVAC
ncbi:general substrate transporter [Jimgerdemannia flammicorona]|uniref:General substrate transporter n=1 Tax=Jimgerdemannia flammicorona TaxID=994334 RepID=A0A433DLP8_9FUNG|nr:general substrate transporter [Jimgerdemannia flammicorona]